MKITLARGKSFFDLATKTDYREGVDYDVGDEEGRDLLALTDDGRPYFRKAVEEVTELKGGSVKIIRKKAPPSDDVAPVE